MKSLTLIKIGGKVVENETRLKALLSTFVEIRGPKALAHGGGKSAAEIATRLGIEAPMHEGRRITNAPLMEIATMVYGGLINKRIVSQLQALGQNAIGFTGADLDIMRAHKRPVKEIDYGFAGDMDYVRGEHLAYFVGQTIVPVLSPITHDGKGQLLNTNADTIAAEGAKALAKYYQVALFFCFEKPGVLSDPDDDHSVIPKLDPALYQEYKEKGVIATGMIPKLDNAFDALAAGVKRVFIGDHHGLKFLHTADYKGTEICL